MRLRACLSKSNSPFMPPSRPTLTMRPRILAASRFWLATGPETRSTMRSTPLPPVAALARSGQPGSAVSSVRSQPNSWSRARRSGLVDVPIKRCAHEPADLHAHEPDAGTRALHQHGLAALETAGGNDRVVHGLQGERETPGLLVTHIVSRDAMGPAGIGGDVFGKAAGSGGHDAVAGLDVAHLAADRLDLA